MTRRIRCGVPVCLAGSTCDLKEALTRLPASGCIAAMRLLRSETLVFPDGRTVGLRAEATQGRTSSLSELMTAIQEVTGGLQPDVVLLHREPFQFLSAHFTVLDEDPDEDGGHELLGTFAVFAIRVKGEKYAFRRCGGGGCWLKPEESEPEAGGYRR